MVSNLDDIKSFYPDIETVATFFNFKTMKHYGDEIEIKHAIATTLL